MYVIVCDIDDTLTMTRDERKKIVDKYGDGKTGTECNDWNKKCLEVFSNPKRRMKDKLIKGAEKLLKIVEKANAELIILTGRNEICREITEKWLKEVAKIPDGVPILMRPNGNWDQPVDCKESVFINSVFDKYGNDATYIFLEDDFDIRTRYSKYGIVLRAPEIWGFLDKVIDD